MCGILGCVVKSKGRRFGLVRKLYMIYKNQELRGKDGCGISIMRDGKLFRVRDIDPDILFSVMYYNFWSKLRKGDLVMLHHRIPTSGGGGDSLRSNHPFSSEDGGIHLVHNGCISNSDYLYNKLISDGHIFESNICKRDNFYNITDSEILVHMLEGCGDIEQNIKNIANKVTGTVAIAFMKEGEVGIWLYRENNPIELFKDEVGNLFFASEMPKENWFKNIVSIDERCLYNIGSGGIKRFRKIRENKKKYKKKKGNVWGIDEEGEWIKGGGKKW